LLLAPLNPFPYLTGVGSKGFIEKTKVELGIRARGRRIRRRCEAYELREPPVFPMPRILMLKTAV